MCGIAGILRRDGASASSEDLSRMNRLLKHRGPDSDGTFQDGKLGLSNTRLAILDLSDKGNQPMSDSSGRYHITFNGEIYNYIELREILETKGHHFRSGTDTEVILAAWSVWGPTSFQKFNGMWAFALWDSHEKKLFLSRDRFGIKPLYYYSDETLFAFSSEIKGFLGVKDIELKITPEGISTYFAFFNLIDGMESTEYKNVFRLLPGHYMEVTAENKAISIKRWWSTLDNLPEVHPLPERQNEKIRELLYDSCKLQLRSDVPTGITLSGGVDSSSVLGIIHSMKKNSTQASTTENNVFIFRIIGEVNSQHDQAERFANSIGANLKILWIDPKEVLSSIADMIYSYEGLGILQSGQWFLYQYMKKNQISVSMDGHGVDECMGGYPKNVVNRALSLTGKLIQISKMLEIMKPGHWKKMVKNGNVPDLNGVSFYIENLMLKKKRPALRWMYKIPTEFNSPILKADYPHIKDLELYFQDVYIGAHSGFLQWILRTFDLASMAHGVEVRPLFLDWRLFCYLLALPTYRKIGKGYTKLGLRESMQGLVPDNILKDTRKYGFPSLTDQLMSLLKPMLMDIINCDSFLTSHLWDGRGIFKEWEQINSSIIENENTFEDIWLYAQTDLLIKQFKEAREKVFQDIP